MSNLAFFQFAPVIFTVGTGFFLTGIGTPVRLLNNKFSKDIHDLEKSCAGNEELLKLLGKGRAKAGMLEGDLEEGELEIGQVSAMIKTNPAVEDYVQSLLLEHKETLEKL